MDVTFTKFVAVLVLCEITNYATGIPIKDSPDGLVNSRDKRSPSDNFSLFGFGIKKPFSVPNPITSVHENLKSLFQPAPDQFQNGNIVPKQNLSTLQSQNEVNNKNIIISKPDEVPDIDNDTNNYGPVITPSISNNKKPDVLHQNINGNKSTQVVQANDNAKNDTVSMPKADINKENVTATSNETTTKIVTVENKNKDLETKIDQKLLDYIFNTSINDTDSTTTDTDENGDYATETGDYNSTTTDDTDDLLRIPAPVVASLLG